MAADFDFDLIQAGPDATDAIGQLAARIWWAHYPEIIGEAQVRYMLARNYSPASLAEQMAGGQVFWLPVAPDGSPVGFVGISPEGEGRYFIHKFYLDQNVQGRGVGAEVFRRLLAAYPDCREIRLTVNRENYKSINFYFKVGFVIEKCIDIPIGEGFVMTDFQMVWRKL